MTNKKRLKVVIVSASFGLIMASLVDLILSTFGLALSNFSLNSNKIIEPICIVQLTDLHNSEFGLDNSHLVQKVTEQEPDLVLITGDLLNYRKENTDIAVRLIEQLTEIAPVYFSYGNHEKSYESQYGINIAALFEEAGAIVLDYDYEDIEINGQQLRIGGIYGYCIPASFLETNEADPEECSFLAEFQDTDRYSILLCHMPYCWLVNNGISEWDIDCVFAGHTHGGQVRIPFVGGLWAPDQGWFPGRQSGLYYSDNGEKVLVLSRGLGNTDIIPRFNNIPEIVVVDLIQE